MRYLSEHWFEPVADHLGSAYLRYSFTRGTRREVDFLVEVLGLDQGASVLDVGCGPGRHALDLAERGYVVHGVDISQRFIDLARDEAPPNATFERLDATSMGFDSAFDAAISLCQGAFGLCGGPGSVLDSDGAVLRGMARAVRPGGRLAVSAFSAYFQVRYLEDHDSFDANAGVNHEQTEVRDPDGNVAAVDLWTTCFTPRELRLLARDAGLEVLDVYSVTPGDYARRPPGLDHAEFLLLARRD